MAFEYEQELVSPEETPVLAAMQQELENFFYLAIDELPSKLRETFILHFKEELSYKEIAEKLNISYDNVRKRVSQARAILKQQYNQDFVGEDRKSNVETFHETSLHPTMVSPTPKEFEGVDLETNKNVYVHQIVIDEEPQAAMLSIPEIKVVVVDAQSDGEKIEKIQDIGQSISEKLNFILPWRFLIAVTHTKPAYAGYFNEAHLRRFIEYFLLPGKVWTDSVGLAALANLNNKIDST
ncbi:RNA polymerase sigma factor [Tolypothrix sp. VBCCA 56010]|uniref:RNA polymerase sigma factor n=1 Tax=Tolypothrix sp. VBCCA 56010 TaxID=3137731 RepID=UPI003D7D9A30